MRQDTYLLKFIFPQVAASNFSYLSLPLLIIKMLLPRFILQIPLSRILLCFLLNICSSGSPSRLLAQLASSQASDSAMLCFRLSFLSLLRSHSPHSLSDSLSQLVKLLRSIRIGSFFSHYSAHLTRVSPELHARIPSPFELTQIVLVSLVLCFFFIFFHSDSSEPHLTLQSFFAQIHA